MRPVENDRWSGLGRAAPQPMASVRDRGVARRVGQLAARAAAGRSRRRCRCRPRSRRVDPARGRAAAGRAGGGRRRRAAIGAGARVVPACALGDHAGRDPHADDLLAAMRRHPDRSFATRSPELPLVVDRERARFGAWYELFPRSQGRDPKRPKATTFSEAEWRLPDIAAMGFDVVYLPPIHPIGRSASQGAQQHPRGDGRTTSARRTPSDRRRAATTRWRRELGGLEGVHPASARRSRRTAWSWPWTSPSRPRPDHPYVQAHPEWFRHSPDGTIKYAENPPKKYQDIYPIDFDGRGRRRARGAVAGVEAGLRGLDRARGADLPGRQPPHQADPVLGLADPRDPARPPRGRSSCRRRSRSRR